MTIINASGLTSRNRIFPVRHLSDGTACIIGTAPCEPDDYGDAISVFASTGGLRPMHPDPITGVVLYEVHLGDFVGVYKFDTDHDCIWLYSYQIQFIESGTLAHGVPASLG